MAYELNCISISEDQLSMLAICSERYALGRMTYVVGEVCQFIRLHMNQLSKRTLYVLINDISSATSLGMDCDERDWKNLLEELRKEYAAR